MQSATDSFESKKYLVDICFPGNFSVSITAYSCNIPSPPAHIYIGMKLIKMGDLFLTHYKGNPHLSFRIPSQKDYGLNELGELYDGELSQE